MTDDGEVELNLPREDAIEWDPPREDVRIYRGHPASGESLTNQEEWYRLEPPNGARPKWTRPGRPLPVIEELRSPGAGATLGVDGPGMNGGGMRVPAPALPIASAGLTGIECRQGDTISFSRFAEARDKDVNSDRRVSWGGSVNIRDSTGDVGH